MERTYQVFKALCEPLGLNVLAAHDYTAENTKTANTRDIILSKAHILICTTGRLLDLVFHEEERRKIHPIFLASQNPSTELKAEFKRRIALEMYRPNIFSSVGVIVLDDAFELFTSESWQKDLTDIRKHLWTLCQTNFGIITVSQVDLSTEEYKDLLVTLDGIKGPGSITRTEDHERWLHRSNRGGARIRVSPSPDDTGKSSTRFLDWKIHVEFARDEIVGNNCRSPQVKILNSVHISKDSNGRPVRTIFIAGTRKGVNTIYAWLCQYEGKKYESELRVMHGELEGEVNRRAHHDYKVGNARILITTSGMVHALNLETDKVNVMFWGSQSKITAESLIYHIAATGKMGRHGRISLYFWFDKNEADAFARLLFYFDKQKLPGHSKQRWLLCAEMLLENNDALTELIGGPQYCFESSLRQIAQWVGGEKFEVFKYFWPTLAVAQSNTNRLCDLEDA